MEWQNAQFQASKQQFFNVIKYVMPQRTLKKYQNSIEYPKKGRIKQKKLPSTEQSIHPEYQKEYAKIQLPTLSQHTFRSTPKSIQSDEKSNASVKKLTNFNKIKVTQINEEENQKDKQPQIAKIQKLNLGIKKKGSKSAMKQYMQSILARTKIDEVVTIKRSAFQPNDKQNKSARVSSLEHSIHEPQQNIESQQVNQRKVASQSKIKSSKVPRPKLRQKKQDKQNEIKLPNVHEHKNLIQMIKEQEQKKRNKKSQKIIRSEQIPQQKNVKKVQIKLQRKKMVQKLQPLHKDIQNQAIPQQIQYSSIVTQKQDNKIEQSNQVIAEMIERSK